MSHRSKNTRHRRRAAHYTRVAAEQGLTLEQYNERRAKEEDARWAQWREQLEADERRRQAEVAAARGRLAGGRASIADYFLVVTDSTMNHLRDGLTHRLMHGTG